MTQTATLTLDQFLLARIAEDEEKARAASPGPWHPNAEHDEVLAVDDITVCEGFALSGPQTRATTAHIARWDPARVLAECAAKRRIVELHRPLEGLNPPVEFICETCGSGENYEYPTEWPCETLKLLAQPYADHGDYRQKWRP